jgi:glycosyltransferase involved in cell wall biosynthesis
MPKVSVVIPVYNTGAYLDRTLKSMTDQTLQDIEIICVDDGSSDDSLHVLKKWERNDARVHVIAFPENRGVCSARNAGLDAALAPYVYFMDSDDWLDADFLEAMYSKADETGQDVVVNASLVREYEDANKKPEIENCGFTEPGYYPPAYVQCHILSVLVLRLYKRDFILRNGIRFPDLHHGGEDNYFASLAEMLQTRSYVFFGPYYHYWQREGSLAHKESRGFSYIQSYRLLYEDLVSRNVPLDGIKLFYSDIFSIDSREVFDYIKSYLEEAGDSILQHRDLYTVLDNLLFDAVLSNPDYESFLAHHHPNLAIDYLRSRIKKQQSHE